MPAGKNDPERQKKGKINVRQDNEEMDTRRESDDEKRFRDVEKYLG